MDGRGWLWKKKSSRKSAAAEKAVHTLDSAGASLASSGSQGDKDNYKKPNYVQISVQSYSHLTGLEDQVKTYEEQVKWYEDQVTALEQQIDELNEKLSAAHSEMTNKDELVQQHTKVAEEAVSGWEKAEAEALALKNHLETVTLEKLTAEDRAAHLDGALKECMRQVRNLKEENEQKLQEVVLSKNKQLDKLKLDLEAKITSLDQQLIRAAAETAVLSRSLQERSNMLIKINEEKSQAEAEIELLKSNIESCEREVNSLKYELHIVAKEMEIRNEEKNMSVKSAEVANKQHMEAVKKIAKLEAECQRLRSLVRKKLPGPAAVAQMKLEVESLGREYGETRVRRSPGKSATSYSAQNLHMFPVPDISFDGHQNFHKENNFLTERLLAMEEETKMLKEALERRNSELQASRSTCAKTAGRLHSLEAQLLILDPQRSSMKDIPTHAGSFSHNTNNQPSTSLSEDGNDDLGSCDDSWAPTLISELYHVKGKNTDESDQTDDARQLELMDDFLEMEKLAGLSNTSGGAPSNLEQKDWEGTETTKPEDVDDAVSTLKSENQFNSDVKLNPSSSQSLISDTEHGMDPPLVTQLQSRIQKVFESISSESDIEKVLEEIKIVVQELHVLASPPVNCAPEEMHFLDDVSVLDSLPEEAGISSGVKITTAKDSKIQMEKSEGEVLVLAVSNIHNLVLSFGKEAMAVHGMSDDENALSLKIVEFSNCFSKVLRNDMSLADFVLALSDVLSIAGSMNIKYLGYTGNEGEGSSPDCIDKVVLPENRTPLRDGYSSGCHRISYSSSNPEVPQEANIIAGFESVSLMEIEQLKEEKESAVHELSRCSEDLEITKSQLRGAEQLLAEVKSQLASSQKANSLAETQLKCMAESYNLLDRRAQELDTEVNLLRGKVESLANELQSEKFSHQDALTKCKDLEEQVERKESCTVCSSAAADMDTKTKQEKELVAAGKLAECQETIFLLGRQLKALHPQADFIGSPVSERVQKDTGPSPEAPTVSGMNQQDDDQAEADTSVLTNFPEPGAESPLNIYSVPFSPYEADGNGFFRSPMSSSKHRPTKSGSSSTQTPERNSRGFTRFFSTKGKNVH